MWEEETREGGGRDFISCISFEDLIERDPHVPRQSNQAHRDRPPQGAPFQRHRPSSHPLSLGFMSQLPL